MNRPADRNHTLILNNTSASCERSKLELHSLGWMDGRGMTHVDITSFSMETDVKGRRGGDGKNGVAAPQARSVARAPRPPSSVQRSCLTETAGLALCPLRSGGSTWLLPARGFFIGCGAGFMAAVWHLTNACPRLLCPYPQHRCDVGVAQLPPQLPTLRGHFANPSVKSACLDSCLDKATSSKLTLVRL